MMQSYHNIKLVLPCSHDHAIWWNMRMTGATAAADLMSLQAGAVFWNEHQVLSERAWQAQRQTLHADYKAKHRAAAKHTHKGRRSRLA